MKIEKTCIAGVPAVIYGEDSSDVYLFVHGKMGNKEEAEILAECACARGYQVLAFDLPGHGESTESMDEFVPWHISERIEKVYAYAEQRWNSVCLYAVSIGAYCSLLALHDRNLKKGMLLSPVADMQKLIENMMMWAGVTEEQLKEKGKIPTDFGEVLDWDYYCYAREHAHLRWKAHMAILYGGQDHLTSQLAMNEFAENNEADLTVWTLGEHWFHTPEQLAVLKEWIEEHV